jgi:cytochrome P450
LLSRARTLVDDVFVRLLLGVREERRAERTVEALGGMLRIPGNPPVPIPGRGARRCIGEALARAEIATIVPTVLGTVRVKPLWPRPERMVLRGTVLVPHRSALAIVE